MKKEATWEIIKNELVFEFYGNPGEHTIWLTEDHCTNILTELKKWIREGEHRKKGIPFESFQTYLAKLKYSIITIPDGNGLLSTYNHMLGKDPKNIFLQRNKLLFSAICDCRHLL